RIFSFPSRGAFHLSLTVLVHYRSLRVFSLGGWSPELPTELHVLRGTYERMHRRRSSFVYGAVTRYGRPFQRRSTRGRTFTPASRLQSAPMRRATPVAQRLQALTRNEFGLFRFRSPLLTESRLISFPRGTEMFQFPRLPPTPYCAPEVVRVRVPGHDPRWV